MLKNANFNKRSLSAILVLLLILSSIFVSPISGIVSAESYTAEELGILETTTYNFDTGALEDYSEKVDTDNNGNINAINNYAVENGVLALTLGRNFNRDALMFDAYSDIETYSIDIKVSEYFLTTANFSARILYYYNGNGRYSAFTIRGIGDGRISIVPTRGNEAADNQANAGGITWTPTSADKWFTVKLTYGTEYASSTNNSCTPAAVNSKYITNITVTDKESNTVIESKYIEATGERRLYSYGIDKTVAGDDATEPADIKIGFMGGPNSSAIYVDNVTVTYRNVEKVQALIDAIGEIVYTPECLEKIEKAEAAYNLLTDAQKAEIDYNFEEAKRIYDSLAGGSGEGDSNVAKVQELIDAIGEIVYTPECLANIEKAEAAYNLLTDAQKAQIDYDFEEAWREYNSLAAASLGIHDNTVYNFDTGALGDYSEKVDFTTDGTASLNGFTVEDSALTLRSNGKRDFLTFDAYSDIETYSIDIKLPADFISSASYSAKIVYYYNGNGYYSAFYIRALSNGNVSLNPTRGLGDDGETYANAGAITWTPSADKWYTVKLTYGTEYASSTYNSCTPAAVNSKYITNITVTDKESNTVIESKYIEATGERRLYSYGIDKTVAGDDATEPADIKVGFIPNQYQTIYVDNITVTYRKAGKVEDYIDAIGAIDSTAACLEKIDTAQKAYNLLSDSDKAKVSNAGILNGALEAAQKAASVTVLPEIRGASVRKNTDPAKQNLRFESSLAFEEIDGWSVVEYGTIVLPKQLLGTADLTLNTTDVKHASATVVEDEELPKELYTELRGIDFSADSDACSIAIAARTFVKYSNGTTSFVVYSENDVSNPVQAPKGVVFRSVYSTARTIAKAVADDTTYSETKFGVIKYTEAVASSDDVSTATGADVLEFVYLNSNRVNKIAAAQDK